jgi:hypothetical protein
MAIIWRAIFGGLLFSAMLATTAPATAQAWDGVATFKIARIDTTAGQNYGFRVHGDQPMCGAGSPPWVYMNVTWDNYQATAALLTSAWLAGRTIIVFSTKDPTGNCLIGYVAFA